MIEKLEIGKCYNLRGVGFWSELSIDVYISAISQFVDAEPILKVNLYDEWFTPYNAPQELYNQLMDDNPKLYTCQIIAVRSPIILDFTDSKNTVKFVFADMVSLTDSSELISATKFNYKVVTGPYTDNDPLNPNNLEYDVEAIINTALKSHIYETIVTTEEQTDLLVPKDEYDLISEKRIVGIEGMKNRYHSAIANEVQKRTLLDQNLFIIDDKMDKANKYLNNARTINSEAMRTLANAQNQLAINNANDLKMREIYEKLKLINNALPPSEQLNLPEDYDIFTETDIDDILN